MALNITVLIEDTLGTNPLLKNEHGLSFFIEKDHSKFLFDTGQSGAFMGNAELLGADLSTVEYVFLSHGHYDHTGGFRALTEKVKGFTLVIGNGFFTEKYSLHDERHTFKGNNFNEEFLIKNKVSYMFVKKSMEEILPGVYVVTRFSRKHRNGEISPRYQLLQDDRFVPDPFTDEILLVIDSPKGLVVFAGCSHPGIRNMLDTVKTLFNRPLHAVFGGIHLIEAPDERIAVTAEYFRKSSLKYLGVCHCTGEKAAEVLWKTNTAYHYIRTGSSLSF